MMRAENIRSGGGGLEMDRDLKADQEICAHFNKLVKQGVYEDGSPATHESVREILKFALAANEGWPYALNKLAEIQGGGKCGD